MDKLAVNQPQLHRLIVDIVSVFSTKQGYKRLIQIIIFEVLRRKLPAMVRFLKGQLQGSKVFVKVSECKDKVFNIQKGKELNDNNEEEASEDEENKSRGQQTSNQNKKQQRFKNINKRDNKENTQILKEVMNRFFHENWNDHAEHIREEVVYHFNIEKLLNDINQNLNIEKKQIQWENLKREVFSFVPFSIIASTLLICTEFLREVMKKKYQSSLKNDYPALHDPQEIACQILNEFFEQIHLIGLKNVKAYVKQKLPKTIQDLNLQESFHIEKIFEHLDDFLGELLKSNSVLKKPADHKKRSSMTLFRSNNRRKQHEQRNQSSPLSYPECNDFVENQICHLLHPLITSRGKKPFRSPYDPENSAIFAHQQPVISPQSKLDIIYLFLGDINDNKIITDNEFIEKHIEIADCKCREQRYQPSLQCIPEAEDDGYESDKSEQLPHSGNSNEYQSGYSSNEQRPLRQKKNTGRSIFHPNQQNDQEQNQPKYRKLSNDFQKNGGTIDDYLKKKETSKKDPQMKELHKKDRFEDFDEEEEEEDDDYGYSSNDQFLLELKGTKKGQSKKVHHLLEQHHQANQRRDNISHSDRNHNKQSGNNTPNSDNLSTKNSKDYKNQQREQKGKINSPENNNFYKDQSFEEDNSKFLVQLSLNKEKFLSQEIGDNEDSNLSINSNKLNTKLQQQRLSNQLNDQQLFIQNTQSQTNNQSSSFVAQEFIQNESEDNNVLDEEEIIENRQRLTHFLQSLCYETLEIMESTNFQTYLYYAILFQYKKFKNRFRLAVYENNLNKNMILMNIVIQIHKIIEEHFLSNDAQQKCDQIYQKYKNEVENILKDKNSHHSQQQMQNIIRIFNEVDQSIIIRESFQELTKFFIES